VTGDGGDLPEHLLIMDGDCALCSGAARWIARHDRRGEFRIATAASPLGRRLLAGLGLDPDDPESWLYIERGQVRTSLEAVIAAGARLGGAGRLLGAFRVLPRPAQNWLYRRIARNRYALFGRAELCALPDPELQRRLIGGV
jgi:predicted DCC family thiol-disulfide oxidoreductase YuxK